MKLQTWACIAALILINQATIAAPASVREVSTSSTRVSPVARGASINNTAKKTYSVVNLGEESRLNVRVSPGTSSRVVTTIPKQSTGVVGTGKQTQVGQSTWVQVQWRGIQGWVNRRYLVVAGTTAPSPRKPTKDAILKCAGTEPFWSMRISEKRMTVDVLEGGKYTAPVSFRQRSANNTSIAVVAGTRNNMSTTAFMQKVEACSDGMSDKNYPYSITAVIRNQKVVSGCCSLELVH
ncbi:COG3650 family protein [Thiolinea disciformis]|uniref:COG3650 family protein n=1 Tax=Thiolinea disciformis TaxID=125614 RepID=UPI00036A0FAC|nr:SH3 domain-containing protein [Thiolinea disciformis]